MQLAFGGSGVRFGTEKSMGFPLLLTAIFDGAVTHDSGVRGRCGWGPLPRIQVGLSRC